MKISAKAKAVVMRAYKTSREVGVFDADTERECLSSGFMRFTTKTLMRITFDGKIWAGNQERIKTHG